MQDPFKQRAEIVNVVKAQHVGDLCYGHVALFQKILGLHDFNVIRIVSGRGADNAFKQAAEMRGA